MTVRAVLGALIVGLAVHPAQAQDPFTARVMVAGDSFPNQPRNPELRARVFAKSVFDAGAHVRFEVAGFTEGLLADREGSTIDDAIAEVDEASVQIRVARVDLLVGYTRAVWGRLDELQPSDVVNPLDMSKFFFDSRGSARMAVGLIRGRLHVASSATLELVAVPRFRRGRFDRLDEPTSPFNPVIVNGLRPIVEEPDDGWEEMQGGARFSATTGRVDWSVGGFRGFRPLPVYTLSYKPFGLPEYPAVFLQVKGAYPRFTMGAADFETTLGAWGIRGEAVVAEEDGLQARGTPVSASGRSVQVGFGADRTIAGYRVMGELLWRDARLGKPSLPYDPLTGAPARFDTRSLTTVGILERRFARETRLVRAFGIYDATAHNTLVRATGAISLREGLWLEGTAGWFAGRRRGLLGPWMDSDFVSMRLTQDF